MALHRPSLRSTKPQLFPERRTARLAARLAPLLLLASALGKTVTLSEIDNHTAVCLIAGDTLVITLPSPVPESYRWRWDPPPDSPLAAVRSDSTPAGSQSFRFNAAGSGHLQLTLTFARQSAGAAPETAQTFSADVTIASGEPASSVLIGVYRGTLPCADCSGLRTELRLYGKGKNDFTETTYLNTRTYVAGRNGDTSFTDRGTWAVLRGDATDPDATVYALNPDRPEEVEYWLLGTGGESLLQLDRQMRRIAAPPAVKLTLKRVVPAGTTAP